MLLYEKLTKTFFLPEKGVTRLLKAKVSLKQANLYCLILNL